MQLGQRGTTITEADSSCIDASWLPALTLVLTHIQLLIKLGFNTIQPIVPDEPRETHKVMGFYMEVLTLGVIL